MRKSGIYQYYVEGEDERSLLNTLKLDLRCIESGKIDKFNVIQSRFTTARRDTIAFVGALVENGFIECTREDGTW